METYYGQQLEQAIKDEEIAYFDIRETQEDCGHCNGTGSHSHRFGAYTGDEFGELDEDFRSSYLSGQFDEQCEKCKGLGYVFQLCDEELPVDAHDYLQNIYQLELEYSEY